ncbi:uncharacterized protein [Drosophila tropicalis]|uniref:uncharacterized protein n=1 Tax=Drosophila tropicalis TaxID=46794 RepID=UPI0035ABDFD1
MFFLHSFIFVWLCFATYEAKTIKKAEANLLESGHQLDDWQGKWFPQAPGEPHLSKVLISTAATPPTTPNDSWPGKWFPYAPGEPHIPQVSIATATKTTIKPAFKVKDDWTGKWFPFGPNEPHVVTMSNQLPKNEQKSENRAGKWFTHGEKPSNFVCDDGKNNLSVDYDPNEVRENYNYLCISSNRRSFYPNMSREAILTEHFLPSAYMPPTKCLNESIEYSHQPATTGAFRPRPAVYGTYSYLPPQRYLRNLAEGAIVMLYHPCAFRGQVEELQKIVRNCLFRHLITPSIHLSEERPLAVLSWRHSLTMSVVDKKVVSQFIQKFAKLGPLAIDNLSRVVEVRDSYKESLVTEARLITNPDDSELCGYLDQSM